MRIAIFGVGGVGGYFGGRLAQTDHEVIFIARGAHGDAIRENGLRITSDSGDLIVFPSLVTDDPAQAGVVDALILATKTWQVTEAANAMRPMIGDDTMVVPLLNGVEAPAQIAAQLGEQHALGGFCRVLSRIEAPGHVVQGGISPFVAFGELDNSETERLHKLREAFEQAGVAVHATPDIQAAMWQKLLFIASFGGVGAVTRVPAGMMRRVPEVMQLVQDAMAEVAAVAVVRGIGMASDGVAQGMAFFESLPDEAMASMQRDIMNGQPSELDAQNGAVVRLGAEAGFPTPTHCFIYTALLPSERMARNLL